MTMIQIPTLLSVNDAARILRLSPSTLAKLRLSGNGPHYYKLGGRVVYCADKLSAWLAEKLRRSTSDTSDQSLKPHSKTGSESQKERDL
jgi:hypothetical protein